MNRQEDLKRVNHLEFLDRIEISLINMKEKELYFYTIQYYCYIIIAPIHNLLDSRDYKSNNNLG